MSPNEAPRNLSLEEMDKQSLLHPYTSIVDHQKAGSIIVAGAKGARVRDIDGREYLDAMGGLWCVNIGYGREEMAEAIAAQARDLAYYHLFFAMAQEPAIRLADAVLGVMPEHMSKVFFCNSGSEANDTQVKIAWYYNNLRGKPEKRKIISRHGAYHGVTVAAASMTGLPPIHKSFNLPLPGFLHTSSPHAYWNAPEGMSERDFSDDAYLSFRACQGTRHPNTVAVLSDLTFNVTLRDGAGQTRSINIGAYGGGVEEPFARDGFGAGTGWQNEFETIRIRLTDFRTNGSGLHLRDVVAVRFEFGPSHGSAEGRISLDDIEVTTD